MQGYDPYMRVRAVDDSGMVWKSADAEPFVLEGFFRRGRGEAFRRLPEGNLPPGVEAHCVQSSGGQLRFKTDSRRIMVRASLRLRDNDADIMTYGRSGFDLYCGEPGKTEFAGVSRLNFDLLKQFAFGYSALVFQTADPGKHMREFTLNFPLYAQVDSFEIGFEPEAVFAPPTPRAEPHPVVCYGTSITQGCCVSRPGLSYTNQLSRLLNRPFLNMGFAGSGRGEPEVAEVLASVDLPGMYLLDYDPNTTPDALEKTLPVFVGILLEKHPRVPILTVSKIIYPGESAEQNRRWASIHRENRDRFHEKGFANVSFLDGSSLLGSDPWECIADNCHPNDLGFYRMASAMHPVLRKILEVKELRVQS